MFMSLRDFDADSILANDTSLTATKSNREKESTPSSNQLFNRGEDEMEFATTENRQADNLGKM